MKILFIGLNQTGVATFWRMFQFGRHLVQLGHDVTICCTAPKRKLGIKEFERDGVKIVETPDLLWGALRSGWDPWQIINRIWWLRGRSFDLVHAFETRPTVIFPALFAKHVLNIPLFLDWCDWFGRGGSVEERTNPFHRVTMRVVDTFFENRFRRVAVGTTVICDLLEQKATQAGVPKADILQLKDGANHQELVPLDQNECRAELGLPQDGYLIGYVGQIYPSDAQLLAASFDLLCKLRSDVYLVGIGYVNRPIKEMVAEPEKVILSGQIPYENLNLWIASCDLCWLPYQDSGTNRGRWPMKLNDYMAVGKPTVATAVGDVTQVINSHKVGILAVSTADDLATKVDGLLSNPSLTAELGKNARHTAETVFDWLKLSQQLADFYEEKLEGRKI